MAHTGTKGVLRAGEMQEKKASPNQGESPENAQALAQHSQGNECVSLPTLRGRLGPGQQAYKKKRGRP